MELRQLEYFQAVAKAGNMSAAARELHVSQPSLSMTISRLEDDLGVHLFDRIGGRIVLNKMGQDLLQNTDRILRELEEIRAKVKEQDGTGMGEVSFGVSVAGYVMQLIRTYLDQFPPVIFHQYYQKRDQLRMQLESGLLDFAISKGKITGSNLQWVPLAEDELLAIVNRNHPLAARDAVYVSELLDQKFVLNYTDLSEDGDFNRMFHPYERKPDIQFIGQEPAVVMEVIQKGLGVGFVSSILLESDPRGIMGHTMKPLHIMGADVFSTLGVTKLKGRYLSAAAQQFYGFTQDFFRSISS